MAGFQPIFFSVLIVCLYKRIYLMSSNIINLIGLWPALSRSVWAPAAPILGPSTLFWGLGPCFGAFAPFFGVSGPVFLGGGDKHTEKQTFVNIYEYDIQPHKIQQQEMKSWQTAMPPSPTNRR